MIEVHASLPHPVETTEEFRLAEGGTRAYTPARKRQVWLQVLQGHVYACGADLPAGAAARILDEGVIAIYATQDSLLRLADLPA
jgi:hypothetical protein